MSAPFVRNAPGSFQPCRIWFYVTEHGWSVIRVVPKQTVAMALAGRCSTYLISILINVCETAIIINRIMGRPDFHGVPRFRGI